MDEEQVIFLTFELKKGYFQVKPHEASLALMTIWKVLKVLLYLNLPQEMRNPPAILQRIGSSVLWSWKGSEI